MALMDVIIAFPFVSFSRCLPFAILPAKVWLLGLPCLSLNGK